mmetsp:Transcript_27896/g.65521  ORF Transcript_27896/g.65521 Transcript_27896/m.65521 type:complete len:234 (+) Transcript_27896:2763-3464(+)
MAEDDVSVAALKDPLRIFGRGVPRDRADRVVISQNTFELEVVPRGALDELDGRLCSVASGRVCFHSPVAPTPVVADTALPVSSCIFALEPSHDLLLGYAGLDIVHRVRADEHLMTLQVAASTSATAFEHNLAGTRAPPWESLGAGCPRTVFVEIVRAPAVPKARDLAPGLPAATGERHLVARSQKSILLHVQNHLSLRPVVRCASVGLDAQVGLLTFWHSDGCGKLVHLQLVP